MTHTPPEDLLDQILIQPDNIRVKGGPMNDSRCDYAGSILFGTIYLDGTISVDEEDARCDRPAAFEGVLPPTESDPACSVKTCLEHLAEYEAEGLLDKRPLRIATKK